MPSSTSLVLLAHLVGLVMAAGCATAKLVLLIRCRTDHRLIQAYAVVVRPITRMIILGLVLLTLSGIGWLLYGYPLTPVLTVKLVFVGSIWVLGPVIDKVVEPKFLALSPGVNAGPSTDFLRIRQQYLLLEGIATGLFYVIIVIWILA